MLTIVLAILAAATNACSSVLQRQANAAEAAAHHTGVAGLVGLLRKPRWLAGLGAVIVSFLLQAGALATGQLSEVQPLMSLELPITLLLASVVFHRSLGGRDWAHILLMTLGMAVFLIALQPTGGSPIRPDGLNWTLSVGTTGIVVVLLVVAGYLTRGNRRAALYGAGSGICFALTAVFMSAVLARGLSWESLSRWQTYLVVVAGAAAMLLLQEALQAGTLVAVQPGVTLSDPVVAVILGVVLFDEQVRTGSWIILEVLGAAAVGWGVVQLSRSPIAASGDSDGAGGDAGDGPTTAEEDTPPRARTGTQGRG